MIRYFLMAGRLGAEGTLHIINMARDTMSRSSIGGITRMSGSQENSLGKIDHGKRAKMCSTIDNEHRF